ncbi:hypothetical protein [uncultured Bacteroides sp.]|uniref:hypothetical protein n=1 Tax=uncultured Bacteroides sp. TaxID=162156 RepID=UPI002AAB9C5F|nr:hypothetical protein [uncultured Bacteroides sp.]
MIIKEAKLIADDDSHTIISEPIETDDLERTRKELHAIYTCDRILFTFEDR